MAILFILIIFILFLSLSSSKPSYHKIFLDDLKHLGPSIHSFIWDNDELYKKLDNCYSRNANIEELDDNGETPLMVVISMSYLHLKYQECVGLLLKYGANPNPQKTHLGATPLMKAVMPRTIISLFNFRASNGGATSLMIPIGDSDDEKSIAIIKLLMRYGAKINAQNITGQTALHIAASTGNLSAIKTLLAYEEIDPTIRNNNGETALDIFEAVQNDPSQKTASVLDVFYSPVRVISNFKENKTYKLLKNMTEHSKHETSERNL